MDYIKFGGESRPVKYGWNALSMFSKLTGAGFQDLAMFETNMTFDQVLALVYVGLHEGARADKVKFDLTIEDIGDFLDDEDFEKKIDEFINVFTDQMPQSKKAKAPPVKGQ